MHRWGYDSPKILTRTPCLNEIDWCFRGRISYGWARGKGMVFRPFAEAGDGVGAWRALITRYGNDSLELRQAKQIEYTQKVYEVKCEDRQHLLDTVHVLEHLFVELDKLECELPDSYKRNTVLLQLRTVAPDIYTAVASKTEMTYTSTMVEVKKLAALNSAVDQPGGGSRTPAEMFYTKTTKKKGKKWTPQPNQCFWYLEMGHGIADCPGRKGGEQPKIRPDGTQFQSGLQEEGRGGTPPTPPAQAFQSYWFNTEAGPGPRGTKEWLVDSGCMTPYKEEGVGLENSGIVCTFGNNESMKAESSGSTSIVVENES